MEPFIDHIEITVRDIGTAVLFYDRLLPLLGYDLKKRTSALIERHDKQVVSYEHPRLGFAITSPLRTFANDTINRRKPGALHHLAFRAQSRADVDRLHLELEAIGATIVSPPREYPEYAPAGYYALYFKDPEGIKYEIVSTDYSRVPPRLFLKDDRGSDPGTVDVFALDEDEAFDGIRCPLCNWRPSPSSRWYCNADGTPEPFFSGCGAVWNTFSTQGRCPGCSHQWRWTSCLQCGQSSLHEDWYEKRRD